MPPTWILCQAHNDPDPSMKPPQRLSHTTIPISHATPSCHSSTHVQSQNSSLSRFDMDTDLFVHRSFRRSPTPTALSAAYEPFVFLPLLHASQATSQAPRVPLYALASTGRQTAGTDPASPRPARPIVGCGDVVGGSVVGRSRPGWIDGRQSAPRRLLRGLVAVWWWPPLWLPVRGGGGVGACPVVVMLQDCIPSGSPSVWTPGDVYNCASPLTATPLAVPGRPAHPRSSARPPRGSPPAVRPAEAVAGPRYPPVRC